MGNAISGKIEKFTLRKKSDRIYNKHFSQTKDIIDYQIS